MGVAMINAYILASAFCASVAAASLFLYTPMGELKRNKEVSLLLFFAYFPITALSFFLLSFTQVVIFSEFLIQSIFCLLTTIASWLLYAGFLWWKEKPFYLIRSPLFIINITLWVLIVLTQTPILLPYLTLNPVIIISLGAVNICLLSAMSYFAFKNDAKGNIGEQLFHVHLILRAMMAVFVFAVFLFYNDINLLYANVAVSSVTSTVLTIGSVYCMFLFERIDKHRFEAETDYLTGLLNRRAFVRAMNANPIPSDSNACPGVVVVCDIDKFKSINDMYGHDAGDEVIKKFASVLSESLRNNDLCARMGGEEFALFLADTTEESAFKAIERIRKSIEAAQLVIDKQVIRFTASFGFSIVKPSISLSQQLKEADDAMYEAKLNGRNRVCGFGVNSSSFVDKES